MLDISGGTFLFVPMSSDPNSLDFHKAEYTIATFRLNDREYLPRARREAYLSYRARLREYVSQKGAGDKDISLRRLIGAIKIMQHPTVWQEMKRQSSLISELSELFKQAPEALRW